MKGFDPKFRDFPDYILGITREIWEDRGIATLQAYYAPDIVLRMPLGIYHGNAGVIAKTMGTLVEFPDRELLGEDVIWCGTPEDGMLSSHRLYCTGTSLGAGPFGPPTGKPVHFRVIADCWAIENQVRDEWLVRDYGGIAHQMGWTARDAAAHLIASEGGTEVCAKPLTPETDQPGPYGGQGNESAHGQALVDVLTRIMAADMAVIPQVYDRAICADLPGHRTVHGWAELDRFWMGLRAAFPSARFQVDHVIGREDPMMPPRAAVRWSLWGGHDGWGAFGAPTGAQVYVMGTTHVEFGPWGIRRECTLFDEVAIWKQILMQVG